MAWFVAHLTPHAPDCAERRIGDPARWLRVGGASITGGLQTLLTRLGRAAADVAVQAQQLGDVGLFTARPGEARVPLAFITEPADAAALNAALQTLSNPQGARS